VTPPRPARALGAALALVFAGAGVTAAAPGAVLSVSPAQVLRMALEAPRLIDYEGTKVITALRGGRVETVTVVESHKRPNKMRLEFLSPEDVAGRLVVDDGATAWHYEPQLNMAFEDRTLDGGPVSRDLTLLQRNYRLALLGSDEVIGRQAYVIVLDPKGSGVLRELWVDRATGAVLRGEDRDAARGVVLSTYFSRISFSLNLPQAYFQFRTPAGARVFTMRITGDGTASPAALAARVRFPVLIPPVLPEGYTFRGAALTRFGSLASVHLQYSDGGNLISFFEAPAGSIGWPSFGQPVRVAARPGRFVDLGYFRVLVWEQRGLRLTAVGTAPTDTLITVASRILAGQEQASVRDLSRRIDSDPATVSRLRGEGLTFPEVTRALILSRHLGTDLPTAIRFMRGTLTMTDLAAQLKVRPEVLKRTVEEAMARASAIPPVAPASHPAVPALLPLVAP
jgi:outer membrane lipoprotein-sorting protein